MLPCAWALRDQGRGHCLRGHTARQKGVPSQLVERGGRAEEGHGFNAWTEFQATALTGEATCAADVTAPGEYKEHEVSLQNIPLQGTRVHGERGVWVAFITCIVGDQFGRGVAFTTKEAAYKFLCLKPSAQQPNRTGGSTPMDEEFDGEGRWMLRNYPVNGW